MWGTYDLLPESARPDWVAIFESFDFENTIPNAFLWWGAICYMIIVSLIEPFYVGAGFALYLNCRTRIEGWDVELAFRRMASRLATAAASVVIGLVFFTSSLTSIQAATPAEDKAKPVIEKVLKDPDFEVHKIQSKRWVPDKIDTPDLPDAPHLSIVGAMGEVLFWVIVVGLVAWLVVYLVNNRHLFVSRGVSRKSVPVPTVVMGMNITRESLPDDIVAAARAAWAAGDFKEALSLLYRGSLSWLVTRRQVPITDSDTEEDCLVHVIANGEQVESSYFKQLTGAWVQIAYAVIPVTDAEMSALCDRWPFVEKGGAA